MSAKLQIHSYTHSKEKLHTCETCRQTFSVQNNLRRFVLGTWPSRGKLLNKPAWPSYSRHEKLHARASSAEPTAVA